MNARPTLGYPTRIAAIRALRQEGKTETQIAEMLGIKPNTVTSLEVRARQRQSDRDAERYTITLPASLFEDVRRAADARRQRPETFVCELLHVVVRDKLVDAVLN